MKHLGISGGGTKIGGLFGAAQVLMQEKGFVPDLISGVSAGSVLSVPLALGKFDEVQRLVLNFDLDAFFSQCPVNRNGRLNATRIAANILTGKPYFGRQDNLERTLSRVVTQQDFDRYKQGNYPVCVVGVVDFVTGGRVYINLKHVSYSLFLKAVNASSSIPIFTNPIELHTSDFRPEAFVGKPNLQEKMYLFDGGVRDHIGTGFMLKQFPEITESVSLYARPEDYRVLSETFKINSVLDVFSRYVDISNVEVSKNDEAIERFIYRERNIPHTFVFLPRIMESVYDTNPARLAQMYQAGRQAAEVAYPAMPPSEPQVL